jgi:hypothetical protein
MRNFKALVLVGMVSASAFGGTTLNLPWTSSSDSTQATLKKALYTMLEANKTAKTQDKTLTGDYRKVSLDDGKTKIVCEEGSPGLLAVQQFSCSISTK